MTSRATSDRRAQNVSLGGLVLQLAGSATLLGVGIWSESDAILTVARFLSAGILIWLILFLTFKQIRRVSIEEMETAELERAQAAGVSTAIFEVGAEELLIERNRLRWMTRWLLPGVTVFLALYFLVGHFVGWGWRLENTWAEERFGRAQNPLMMMWLVVGVGFLSFLYARYTIALSRIKDWGLLHAGATYMAANAIACLVLGIALMASATIDWAEPIVAYFLRVVMVVLGIELTANFILDLYRPRIPGEVSRPSFDSRLLGLVSEPGGIAKSIADAVNYQFGFEVSSTWFYQLLQRWMFPLLVLTCLLVFASTSIVIIDAEEDAIIERLGRRVGDETSVLGPGITLKWPYPVDKVYRVPVRRVSDFVVGEGGPETEEDRPEEAIVWTRQHEFVPELMVLVASPEIPGDYGSRSAPGLQRREESDAVPVGLLLVSVPIQYRVTDLNKFLYGYVSPEKLMEGIAYQILSEYAAGLEVSDFIGPGRERINREVRRLLQQRFDEMDLGVEIVFAGVRGAHPPAADQVAEAFESVITAEIEKESLIRAAQREAQTILTRVAGTVTRAQELDRKIIERERLTNSGNPDPDALVALRREIDELLVGNPEKGITLLSGEASEQITKARGRASELIAREAAKLRAFDTEVLAYRASPSLYTHRKMLEVYGNMDHLRKYLIVGDSSNVIIEYETKKPSGLDQVLEEGLEQERGNP